MHMDVRMLRRQDAESSGCGRFRHPASRATRASCMSQHARMALHSHSRREWPCAPCGRNSGRAMRRGEMLRSPLTDCPCAGTLNTRRDPTCRGVAGRVAPAMGLWQGSALRGPCSAGAMALMAMFRIAAGQGRSFQAVGARERGPAKRLRLCSSHRAGSTKTRPTQIQATRFQQVDHQ